MDSSDFKESDKQVFNALLNWPGLTDREISKKIGLKESTFRAARLRLEEKNLVMNYTVPNLIGVGCELLFMGYAKIKTGISFESRDIFIHSINMKFNGAFFIITSENQILLIGAAKNLTAAKKYMGILKNAELGGILESDSILEYYVPFETIQGQRFFEFAPMAINYFQMDNVRLPKFNFHHGEMKELSDNEKTVFYGLCKWPNIAGAAISEKLGMPKPTFSVIQRRLLGENIINPITIPNLKEISCEMLVFIQSSINPHRVSGIDHSLFGNNSVFSIISDFESYDLLIFKNYSKFQEVLYKRVRELEEEGIMVKSPTVQVFSIPNSDLIRFLKFDPLMRDFYNLIEIEDELGEIIIKNYVGKDRDKARTAVSGVLTEVATMVGEETTEIIYKSKVEKLKLNNRMIKDIDILNFIDTIQKEVIMPLLGGKSKKVQRFRELLV